MRFFTSRLSQGLNITDLSLVWHFLLCHRFLDIQKAQEGGASIRVRTYLMWAVFYKKFSSWTFLFYLNWIMMLDPWRKLHVSASCLSTFTMDWNYFFRRLSCIITRHFQILTGPYKLQLPDSLLLPCFLYATILCTRQNLGPRKTMLCKICVSWTT